MLGSSFASRPIVVDLFSGAGGMSLGFERAGFDVVVAVEREAVHAATYSYNFPNTVVLQADVGSLDLITLTEAAREGLRRHGRDPGSWDGNLDVVAGGPPCQGFSVIGKREASEKRNKLVYAFSRIVEEAQPRYFLMENVPGMAVGEQEQILRRLMRRLTASGYSLVANSPQLINAADFGVPQDRKRLFLVGARKDQNLPDALVRDVFSRTLASGITVDEAIGDLPDANNYERLLTRDDTYLSEEDFRAQLSMASTYALQQLGIESSPDDLSYRRAHDPRLLTCSLRTMHTKSVEGRFRNTTSDTLEPISRFHRLDGDGRARTIRAGTGPDHGSHTSARPIHHAKPRVITAREAARLQSFPDWFRFHRTRWHAFRQIGNAVPPLLACAVAQTIFAAAEAVAFKPRHILTLTRESLLSLNETQASEHFACLAVMQSDLSGHVEQAGCRKQNRAPTSRMA